MNAEKLWKAYHTSLCRDMGSSETTSDELHTMGKACMGDFFQGVYARGKQPKTSAKRCFLIVNTDKGPPGEHWVGIYREPGHKDMVYDSFGRGTMQFDGEPTETDAEQQKHEKWCGQACLAFGLTAKLLGQGAKTV
jgi:hypothetical protein